jgi:predicted O-linked N-acetylglucosamine transferase (SPINDLY family)
LVRKDRIDILVDLSGHSDGHRLGVFGRKPAPIQATGWGLGTGNGMPMIDYLLSDTVSIPAEVRHLFAETVVDLPSSMTFEAPSYAPVGPLPALERGAVTFGCFNRLAKLSDQAMRVWAEILAAVPRSRLILKDPGLDDPLSRAAIGAAFAARGVGSTRLDMRGRTSHVEQLAHLGEVDIALDPFPQNGGISTWEALWMGCPTVTKLGTTIPGRASASILTSIGLSDWVVGDDAAYVALAVGWANDLLALSGRRKEIRRAIMESDAGNPDRYVRRVESAFRRIWEKWCADSR